jgi:hypothetical protein
MKQGGNAAASVGLGVKVGSSSSSSQKYTTRAAMEYKSKLANLVKMDQAQSPEDAFVKQDPNYNPNDAAPHVNPPQVHDKDTWFDFQNASKSSESKGNESPSPAVSNTQPIIADQKSTINTTTKKSLGKLSKLGAVKAVDLDFDKIQMNAKSDVVNTEEGDPFSVVKDSSSFEPVNVEKAITVEEKKLKPAKAVPRESKPKSTMTKDQEAAVSRLGMGMKKLNIKQNQPTASSSSTTRPPSIASDVDSNSKSISSDQYFKQDNPDERNAIQEKLRQTNGKTSISSSDFFKDQQDDEDPEEYYEAASPSMLL